MNKGFSIITDFGCKTGCPYCIWKTKHSFYGKSFCRENYLESVKNFILNVVTDSKFSISGGGDPLNNFEQNSDFWKIVYNSCYKTDKMIDIHTSYINWDDVYCDRGSYYPHIINRMVLHSNCEKIQVQLPKIISYSRIFPKIRINFVVTNDIDIKILEYVEKILKKYNIQLSYRQYIGNEQVSEKITKFCSTLSERYKFGRYVEQNDYNIYLFPDGKIYSKFLF